MLHFIFGIYCFFKAKNLRHSFIHFNSRSSVSLFVKQDWVKAVSRLRYWSLSFQLRENRLRCTSGPVEDKNIEFVTTCIGPIVLRRGPFSICLLIPLFVYRNYFGRQKIFWYFLFILDLIKKIFWPFDNLEINNLNPNSN